MSAPVAMSSLLAIALVRRLLLELKLPEGQDLDRVFGQSLEVWVSQSMEDFDGLTPAQTLAAPGGDDMVRSWLERGLR